MRRDTLDQRIDKPAIHLKKRALIHAIIDARGAIDEGIRAPLRDAAWRLAFRAFGQKLYALQLGDFAGKGLRKIVEPALSAAREP